MKQIALDIGLPTGPTLDNYVPAGNLQALQHLRLWASNPTRSPVPIYLWGESGSGKTHLLKAVAQALGEQGAQTGWLDAAQWSPAPFSPQWPAVLMDDVHLYDAEQQHAAFNWFVHAAAPASGPARAVIAAGRLPPGDLKLREDLRSRLGWGHVFQLQVPPDSERRAVLRRAADERGIFLSDEVMSFMLNRFPRDLGSLMQWLDQLDRYSLQSKRAVTVPLLKAMLENL